MVEEKKSDKIDRFVLWLPILALAIGIAILVVVMVYPYPQTDIQHLKELIPTNHSSDPYMQGYIQGWTDCIHELERYRQRATNVTTDGR